jgi:hypothetical protein
VCVRGAALQVWQKGSPSAFHFLASADWCSVEWKDVKTKERKGALDLRAVTEVVKGKGTTNGFHKGLMTRREADAECCIVLTCSDEKRCVWPYAAGARCVRARPRDTCRHVCVCLVQKRVPRNE